MAIEVTPPFKEFTDLSGAPLDNGYIYIGTENLNPEVNLISIYWDSAMTIPASNPLRTISGYPARNGSPARIYCGAQYSITVKDKSGVLVYSSLSGNLGSVVSYVDSVSNLATLDNTNTASGTVIVKDLDRGGTFIWSATGTANGGTVFAGATGFWNRQYSGAVHVKWFGAVGDGVTDDTVAIQNTIDYSLDVYLGNNLSYKLSNALNLRSGSIIFSDNCSITQTAIRTQIFNIVSKVGIKILNINFIGLESDFNNSAGSRADGIYASGSEDIIIEKCMFEKLSHSALTCTNTNNIKFIDNTITGINPLLLTPISSGGCVGVVIDVGCNGATISRNTISSTSIGVQSGDLCSNIMCSNNYIFDIVGQHGFYIGGGQTNISIIGNTINNVSLIGIKVQQYDTPARDTTNVTITANTITNTGAGDGIHVISTATSPTYFSYNVVITGNTIANIGQDGILCKYVKSGSVSNNTINVVAREGISFGGTNGLNITGNVLLTISGSGIREIVASTYTNISNNIITNPAAALITGNKNGIYIAFGSEIYIDGNKIIDTTSKMVYGIFIEGGMQSTFIIKGNCVNGATSTGLRTVVATEFRYFGENILIGAAADTTGTTDINQRGTLRQFYSTAVPSTGTWKVGDYVRNRTPSVGQPKGWYCTLSGTPGTWVSEGNL